MPERLATRSCLDSTGERPRESRSLSVDLLVFRENGDVEKKLKYDGSIVNYLSKKDKVVASLMALSTVGLLGAFSAQVVLGTNRALAEPTATMTLTTTTSSMPGTGSLGALVLGSISLALTRRILRG
jgi:hypothetical protein